MELKDYVAPLRKWWWLIIAAGLVAGLASFYAASQQPDQFKARTTLMIGRAIDNPNPSGTEFWLTQQLAQTYAEIANREPVRDGTKAALGMTWLPEYSVRALPDTQLIEISVTDTDANRSEAVANELTQQLILQSPTNVELDEQSRQSFISDQLDSLEANIRATEEEIAALQEDLATEFSARQIADSQSQIAALQAKLNTLQSNYANLLANTRQGAINTLNIIEPATVSQVGLNQWTTVLVATAIGVSLAIGAAYLLEFLDDTISTQEEIERLVELPTLAGIARIEGDENSEMLVAFSQPRSPVSEAYRVLRTGIQFSSVDNPDRAVLMITSASPSEGKSLTVANLAIVMAQAGHKVLVVDADLRRPVQHKLFGLSLNQGITSFMLEFNLGGSDEEMQEALGKVIQPTLVDGLFVLPSGTIPPNPSELLGSTKMAETINKLAADFDYVLIDSPPVLAVTDAVVLSMRSDGVLLVADAGSTRRGQLKQAVEQLRSSSAHLLGVVLNRLTPKSDGYYTYYYYRQSYYIGDASEGDKDKPKKNGRGNGRWRRSRKKEVAQESS
ncbi:MAG: polysaccharide biosynthesis tyrosine autokinase [Candidatus Promineifilaceae bacterium]